MCHSRQAVNPSVCFGTTFALGLTRFNCAIPEQHNHIWRQDKMKRLLAVVAMLGLTGLGFNALAQETQSTPSAQSTPSTQTPDSMQQPVGSQGDQRSAQSFEGKITKS